jgi:hypothetical protein
MTPKGVKEPPVCSKCGLNHWPFRPCSTGVKLKQIGYDMEVKETGYGNSRYPGLQRETGYTSPVPASVKERAFYKGDE